LAIPAAIPQGPSIFGGQSGTGEGGRPENPRADVYRLGRSRVRSPAGVVGGARVRSRFRSPAAVIDGARFSQGDIPLWLVFRGSVDKVKAAAS
jgi:hypothetical protein